MIIRCTFDFPDEMRAWLGYFNSKAYRMIDQPASEQEVRETLEVFVEEWAAGLENDFESRQKKLSES